MKSFVPLALIVAFVTTASDAQTVSDLEWPAYGGDAGGTRYSSLTQINKDNVSQLQLAWTYRTGELGQNADDADDMTFQSTPILDSTKFARINRSQIVNLDRVRDFTPAGHGDLDVRMDDGTTVRLSRRYRDRIGELGG